jgi:8-amino-7-oxononanoate synthase
VHRRPSAVPNSSNSNSMPIANISAQLSELAQADQLRHRRIVESIDETSMVVDGQRVLQFASNDYLGLAQHPRVIEATMRALKKHGLGAGASHMVTGHHRLHEELEERLAKFVCLPKALLFGSGYAANLGILTALAGKGDVIFADKLNHACLNDGAVLSRATFKRYAHNDIDKLRSQLADWRINSSKTARILIVSDAVFSVFQSYSNVPKNTMRSWCSMTRTALVYWAIAGAACWSISIC